MSKLNIGIAVIVLPTGLSAAGYAAAKGGGGGHGGGGHGGGGPRGGGAGGGAPGGGAGGAAYSGGGGAWRRLGLRRVGVVAPPTSGGSGRRPAPRALASAR